MAAQASRIASALFDKSQQSFASGAQRIAWYLGASLLPYREVIPPGLPAAQAAGLAQGEKSLHAFLTALYTDMYHNPAPYAMAETPDLTFNDGEWLKHRPDIAKIKDRNAHVLQSLKVLLEVAHQADLQGDTLTLSGTAYDSILAGVNRASVSRPKMRTFISSLARQGLMAEAADGVLRLAAGGFPGLLTVLKQMAVYQDEKQRKATLFAFYRADFQALLPNYSPDPLQMTSILPPDMQLLANRVIREMQQAGYTMELQLGWYPSMLWAVLFSGVKRFKASSFFWLGYSIEYRNRFSLELHCMNPQHLIPLAQAKGTAYTEWFSSMWRQECNDCGYCHGRFKVPGPYMLAVGG